MKWWERNRDRLRREIELMQYNGVNFRLYYDSNGNLLWRGPLTVGGHTHRDVRLVYPENFPYEPIVVYVLDPKLPKVNHHIHDDGSICYMKRDEWTPEWTAFAVYLTTIRFLDEFYSGRMV